MDYKEYYLGQKTETKDKSNALEKALSDTLLKLVDLLEKDTNLNNNDISVNPLYHDDIFLKDILSEKMFLKKFKKGAFGKKILNAISEICRVIQFNNSNRELDDLSAFQKLKRRL